MEPQPNPTHLNVIDDYNREVLAINGPEFISTRLAHWTEAHQIQLEHMYVFHTLEDVRQR